jgi:hypothetical protein
MKLRLTSAAAGIALLAGIGVAGAQDIIITPEQDTVIREYVKKEPLASINLPGIELNIGSRVPDTVEVRKIPDVDYEYTVVENRTVLVEPGTRKIIKVYE